jgi:hypothetical protein
LRCGFQPGRPRPALIGAVAKSLEQTLGDLLFVLLKEVLSTEVMVFDAVAQPVVGGGEPVRIRTVDFLKIAIS